MNVKYPYEFDSSGRTAQTDLPGHISDLIEQISRAIQATSEFDNRKVQLTQGRAWKKR